MKYNLMNIGLKQMLARFANGCGVVLLIILAGNVEGAASTSEIKDPFLNPFSEKSAHHRPIGTGAKYATDDDPATKDWLKANTLGINVGAPWGVSTADTTESDPVMTIAARTIGGPDRVVGLPVSIRLPKKGFTTKVVLHKGGSTDGVVVIYDRVEKKVHQLRQYDWNDGHPFAGQYKTWDLMGLGHGTHPGDRLGTSASGVAALFGLLRGQEINTAGFQIQHALQMVMPRNKGQKIMLSRTFILPAVSMDGTANKEGNNTGHIPYGALIAIPPDVDLDKMGLSEPGRRLAEAMRDYGIYAVDGGGGNGAALRADQWVDEKVKAQLKNDIPKFYPLMRMVLNNDVMESSVAGGGKPLGVNSAIQSLSN